MPLNFKKFDWKAKIFLAIIDVYTNHQYPCTNSDALKPLSFELTVEALSLYGNAQASFRGFFAMSIV